MVYVTDVIKKQFRSLGRPRTVIKRSNTGHGNKPPAGENISGHHDERTGLLRPGVAAPRSCWLENQCFSTFLLSYLYITVSKHDKF